ncbi:MAG: M60 family metallopeptidase [Verrucomicrobiota bacterium]
MKPHFLLRVASVPIFLLLASGRLAAASSADDLSALTRGVKSIQTDGTPGGVAVFGPDAFAVVAGAEGAKALLPVVAAARLGKGRIVAFGHDGFLRTPDLADTGLLLTHSARWVANDRKPGRIGVVGNPKLLDHLVANGLRAEALDPANWITRLADIDAVCVSPLAIPADQVATLDRFIREGGGLVTGVTGWGWMQIFRKDKAQLAAELPANRLLEPAGLAITAGTPGRTLPGGYAIGGDLTLLNATHALQAITEHAQGTIKLSAQDLARCSTTLGDAVRALPPGDPILLPKLAELSAKPVQYPSESAPLRSEDAFSRLLVTLELERPAPFAAGAHPAAADFPGAVPADAPRIKDRRIAVDLAVPDWHSTGLYAAPGEEIQVTLPVEARNLGLAVRIGCHTDRLWHLDAWKRVPEISRSFPLQDATSSVSNPFGGLIYLVVSSHAPQHQVEVRISGAVEAPRFVLGKTTVEDWKNRVRHGPAPWAELETQKVILSVPSAKIRQLDNPDELMALWDRILDAEADLASIPRERRRPERIVPDVQISAGYMHSGYPIMTWLDGSVEHSLSTEKLSQGSWGHFHELGHNHQQPDWTFDGTGEVTCNLFSLYVMETVCGQAPGSGHEALDPAAVAKRLTTYLTSEGDRFAQWKSDPFLALTMYDQLRVGFGWDTFKKVFAEYRALPASEHPRSDDDRRDQWLVRFSRAAGHNLGPFFEAWGVPTRAAARESISTLPPWMPANWPQP